MADLACTLAAAVLHNLLLNSSGLQTRISAAVVVKCLPFVESAVSRACCMHTAACKTAGAQQSFVKTVFQPATQFQPYHSSRRRYLHVDSFFQTARPLLSPAQAQLRIQTQFSHPSIFPVAAPARSTTTMAAAFRDESTWSYNHKPQEEQQATLASTVTIKRPSVTDQAADAFTGLLLTSPTKKARTGSDAANTVAGYSPELTKVWHGSYCITCISRPATTTVIRPSCWCYMLFLCRPSSLLSRSSLPWPGTIAAAAPFMLFLAKHGSAGTFTVSIACLAALCGLPRRCVLSPADVIDRFPGHPS